MRLHGGVPKRPLRRGEVDVFGLRGDAHNDTVHHGGVEKAISLYSLELILALQAEGHPIYPGSTGENVTIAGLDWSRVVAGARLWLGDGVEIEITPAGMSVSQDGRELGSATFPPASMDGFSIEHVRWSDGVYGPLAGRLSAESLEGPTT